MPKIAKRTTIFSLTLSLTLGGIGCFNTENRIDNSLKAETIQTEQQSFVINGDVHITNNMKE